MTLEGQYYNQFVSLVANLSGMFHDHVKLINPENVQTAFNDTKDIYFLSKGYHFLRVV